MGGATGPLFQSLNPKASPWRTVARVSWSTSWSSSTSSSSSLDVSSSDLVPGPRLHPRWLFSMRSFSSESFHLGLPELPGRELCEHSNLPDDRRWCDLPGGLLGLLWRLEGEQVPDLHLRFLPRCYPRRSGTTSSHPFKNRTNLFRPFEYWTNLLLGSLAPLNS